MRCLKYNKKLKNDNKLKTYIAHASWQNDHMHFTWIYITKYVCQFLWAENMLIKIGISSLNIKLTLN